MSFVSPVTVWLVVLASLPTISPQSPQVPLLPVRCRTCQVVIPVSPGCVQLSVTCVSPTAAVKFPGCAGATPMLNVRLALSGLVASLSVTVYVYAVVPCEVSGVPLRVRVAALKLSPEGGVRL